MENLVSTIEYEPGLIQDFPEALQRLFPKELEYKHELTWHDGNGHSHVRASFLGQSFTVPFKESRLILGTWQQIIFVELDNKPRHRKLIVQLREYKALLVGQPLLNEIIARMMAIRSSMCDPVTR